jgi:hypothetical protein
MTNKADDDTNDDSAGATTESSTITITSSNFEQFPCVLVWGLVRSFVTMSTPSPLLSLITNVYIGILNCNIIYLQSISTHSCVTTWKWPYKAQLKRKRF